MTIGTLADTRVRWASILALITIVLMIALHIPAVFFAVGDATILWITDLANVLAAVLGCILSLLLYFSFDRAEPHKAIWGFLGLGLLLWSLGEIMWAFYELVLEQELPYPSAADVMWVIGYIPLVVGLWLRYRSLRRTTPPGQLLTVLAVSAVLAALAIVFVIGPIVTYPEYEPIEKFLDALYPIGDMIVGIGALFSVLALSGGALSRSWVFAAAGFLLIACSDLLFSYTTWNEIYVYDAPDLLSAIVDISYFASYILIALGVYIQARIQRVA